MPGFTAIQKPGTIIILYILIFTFLARRWEDKNSGTA
jgi:cytochrome c1